VQRHLTVFGSIATDPKSAIPRKLQEWVDGVLAVQVRRRAARCSAMRLTFCDNSLSCLPPASPITDG
jgi:hypothetical protein